MKVYGCDPFISIDAAWHLDSHIVRVKTREEIYENCDIISLHVPLLDDTKGMINKETIAKMKDGAIFINSSRGEVVVDEALLKFVGKMNGVILDVWNGEPGAIPRDLIAVADIATPHIAGYSYEGKINGTAMSVQAFARHFGIAELVDFVPEHTPVPKLELRTQDGTFLPTGDVAKRLLERFPIYELDGALRNDPASFEKIRAEYKYRREFVWQ